MKKLSLKEKYEAEVAPALVKELSIQNKLAVPKIKKIVINMGTQDRLKDKGVAEKIMTDLGLIAGQQPQIRPARISEAGFGIRAGNPVGLKVTLRGEKMYGFLGRLIAVVLPRLRDFKGVSTKSFDSSGNYTLGIADYSVFPEISLASIDRQQGLEITVVIDNGGPDKSKRLLELMGMPFEKEENG